MTRISWLGAIAAVVAAGAAVGSDASDPGMLGNPPIGDFQGSTTVNILDVSQPVLITIPQGFRLTPTNAGYVVTPLPTE